MENIAKYFSENQHVFGIFLSAVGGFLLLAVIMDWDWILEGGNGPFNIASISKYFGRNAARVLMGILSCVIIASGLAYFFLFRK